MEIISDSPCAELPDAVAVGPDHPQGRKCKNPATKASIEEAIKTFVAGLVNLPPEIVVLYFAGHGIRVGGKMFLVPSNANLDSEADLEQLCMSLEKGASERHISYGKEEESERTGTLSIVRTRSPMSN